MTDRPVFYYDFNSPYAWLAAERVNSVLPVPPVWQPVSFGHILQSSGREPWSFHEPTKSAGIAAVEDVKDHPGGGDAGAARHERKLSIVAMKRK